VSTKKPYGRCPESLGLHSPLDGDGRCSWCEQKVGSAQPAPPLERWVSVLWLAYRYYYDPDYGTRNIDQY